MTTKAKPFFEVFPTLDLKGTLYDKLEQTQVERVSATKQKDRLSVYLFSTRLLLKEDIWAAEKAIKSQLFPHALLKVRIFERFELSSQYTPENLMEVYRESILAELREYSHVEYNAFRTAGITYPEAGQICLSIDDTVLNRSKEGELVRVLEKILVERCGLKARVDIDYREVKGSRFSGDDEMRLQMKVNEIILRAGGRAGAAGQYGQTPEGYTGDGAGAGNGAGTAPGAKASGSREAGGSTGRSAPGLGNGGSGFGKKSGGSGQDSGITGRGDVPAGGVTRQAEEGIPYLNDAGKGIPYPGGHGKGIPYRNDAGKGGFKGKGDFRRGEFRRGDRPLKQSDNPDVIYGKDFDEEVIPIDEIIGEVGDVTIRGNLENGQP